jgi:hypothetical protein
MSDQSRFYRTAPRRVIHAFCVVLAVGLSAPVAVSAASASSWLPHADEPGSDLDRWRDSVQPVLENLWNFVKCAGELNIERPIEDQMADVSKCIATHGLPGPLAPEDQEDILRDVHGLQDLLTVPPMLVSRESILELQVALDKLEEAIINGKSVPERSIDGRPRSGSDGQPIRVRSTERLDPGALINESHTAVRSTPDTRRSAPAATIPGWIDTKRSSAEGHPATPSGWDATPAPERSWRC